MAVIPLALAWHSIAPPERAPERSWWPREGGNDSRGRNHSDARVGCIVWSTTSSSSPVKVRRSSSSRRRAEGPDGLVGVVAAAVEPSVHGLLDATAGRLEQGGHRQCRSRHHKAGASV